MESRTSKTTELASKPLLLGRYRFDRVVGQGRFGRVVRVRDEASEEVTFRAIKGVPAPGGVQLVWEAQTLAAIAHPRLVPVYEVIRLDADAPDAFGFRAGSVLLVEGLAEGERLDRGLEAPEIERVLGVADDVLSALSALHVRGLAHGDVKSENVLVDSSGRATLIDLGLCRRFGRSDAISGTPRAMAPECWLGFASPASDIYALGVMLLELLIPRRLRDHRLTGQYASPGYVQPPSLELLPAAIPKELRRCLAELVEPLVERRVATASDAREKLRLASGLALSPREATQIGEDSPEVRAMAAARLPYAGSLVPVETLERALEQAHVIVVDGPKGSGRTRLVEEAALRHQAARVIDGRPTLTVLRVRGDAPLQLEPSHPSLVFIEGACHATLAAARRMVRASQVAGVEVRVVLEGEVGLAESGAAEVDSVIPAALDRNAAASLLESAVGAPVPAALVDDLLRRSSGRAGTLCRAVARGLRAGIDFRRRDVGALMSFDEDTTESGDMEIDGVLAMVAVAGGSLESARLPSAAAKLAVGGGFAYLTDTGALGIESTRAAKIRNALPKSRRRAIASALLQEDLDIVAFGYASIETGNLKAGLDALRKWADAELDRGEPARVVERLGSLDAPTEVRRGLAESLAEAERRLGRYDQGEAHLATFDGESPSLLAMRAELARLSGDSSRARRLGEDAARLGAGAAAYSVLARLSVDRGDVDRALEFVDRIGPLDAQSPDLASRAVELKALIALQRGEPSEAERLATSGLVEAIRAKRAGAAARLSVVLGSALLASGRPSMALPVYEQAVELASRAGELHLGAAARLNLGLVRIDLGVIGPGRRDLESSAKILAKLGRDADMARALYNLARAALLTADVTAGRRFAALAREAAEVSGDDSVGVLVSIVEADVALREGRRADVKPILEGGASRASALSPPLHAQYKARAAPLFVAAGCVNEARQFLAAVDVKLATVDAKLARLQLCLQEGDVEGAVAEAVDLTRTTDTEAPWEQQLRVALASADAHEAEGAMELANASRSEARRLLDKAFRHLEASDRHRLRQVPSLGRVLAATPSGAPPEDPTRWRVLATEASAILTDLRFSRLVEHVLRTALSTSGAERALLVELEPTGVIRVVAGMSPRGPLHSIERSQFSRSICARGWDAGLPLASSHAVVDERLSVSESVEALSLRSVAFVPVPLDRAQRFGIYVDDRQRPAAFSDEDVALLSALGRISAGALALAIRRKEERREIRRRSIERRDLRRALDRQTAELAALREHGGSLEKGGLLARSPGMLEVLRMADRVSRTNVPVLIMGETGTGKGLVARRIHEASPRSGNPFVAENCGAIPEALLESALFGHVRGAFTGADRTRSGLFEAADGGTLFLDEIGEMSAAMQVRLLRVIEDGEVRPLGSTSSRKVDVRVVAASHRDLNDLVARGEFREDLYFRLAVVRIHVPPLRERLEDLAILVAHFLEKHGDGPTRVTREAMDTLARYAFPGNVRELENEVRRALALCEGEIRSEHFSQAVRAPSSRGVANEPMSLREHVDALERQLIREALSLHGGNRTRAAEALGLSRYGLHKMIARLGLRD